VQKAALSPRLYAFYRARETGNWWETLRPAASWKASHHGGWSTPPPLCPVFPARRAATRTAAKGGRAPPSQLGRMQEPAFPEVHTRRKAAPPCDFAGTHALPHDASSDE